MPNEMKVIMERWDRFVIKEQEPEASAGPETVGQIIKSIDDLILIKGDKTKRVISSVIEALKVLVDSSQDLDYLSEDIQKIIEWFEEELEVTGLADDFISADNLFMEFQNYSNSKVTKRNFMKKVLEHAQ